MRHRSGGDTDRDANGVPERGRQHNAAIATLREYERQLLDRYDNRRYFLYLDREWYGLEWYKYN